MTGPGTSTTQSDPPPVLEPGLVVVKVGDDVTMTTTRSVVLGQDLGQIDNAEELPPAANFTLLADDVQLMGPMTANGWHILIVARSISAVADAKGRPASITVDGAAGTSIEPATRVQASSGTAQGPASAGSSGSWGNPGTDGLPGKQGGDAQDAGSIRIYCKRAEKPLDLTLSAVGGAAGEPQHGQDGGNGGTGGAGFSLTQVGNDVKLPTSGGRGGRVGRGGTGAAPARAGNGGTIVFHATDADSPLPAIADSAAGPGAAGAYGRPGATGTPGAGGAAGKGGQYWGTNQYWQVKDASQGWPGEADGVLAGGVLTSPSAGFKAPVQDPDPTKASSGDVGRLVELGGGGPMYAIKAVTDGHTMQLLEAPPDAPRVAWRTFTIAPWSWVPAGKEAANPPWSTKNLLRGSGGSADGSATFTLGAADASLQSLIASGDLSFPCTAADVGKLLIIPDRGTYVITGAAADGSVTLDHPVPAGTPLRWVRVDGVPGVQAATVQKPSAQAGAPYAEAAALVSDDYLHMQADRARFVYLAMDPAVVARVADLGANPDPDDPAVKAATAQEGEITERLDWTKALIDSRTAQQGSTMDLVPLWCTLDAMQTSLANGLDAFGHSANWVPPLRYQYYSTLLQGAIDALRQAETDATANRTTAIALLQQGADLTALASNAKAEEDKLSDDADRANATLLLLTPVLDQQDKAVNDALAALVTAVATWSNDTRQALEQASGLDAAGFFDAISQIAFLGDNPLGDGVGAVKTLDLLGSTAGKVGSDMAAEPVITDDNGQKVPIRYELNSLHTFGKSLDDLKSGMAPLADGTLSPDTTNDMLIGPRQALDTLIETFSGAAGADAQAASDDMDGYVSAVSARNATILRYNEALCTLRSAQQGINAANELYGHAQNLKVTTSTLGLAEHLVDHAVDRAREWCIDVLYRMSRAYMAFALSASDEFYSSLDLGQAWSFDSHKAGDQQVQLVQDWTNKYEQYAANPSPGFGPTGDEDLQQDGAQWAFDKATFPDPFDDLLAKGQTAIVLPPSRRSASTGGFTSDDANVHLRIVRCWLEGATSKTGLISLKLVHRGDDTFVTENDVLVPITHDPTPIPFRYLATNPADVGTYRSVMNTQPHVGIPVDGWVRDGNKDFFEIGPFATWEIHVVDYVPPALRTATRQSSVDLSGVERIVFEFFYYFQEFSQT